MRASHRCYVAVGATAALLAALPNPLAGQDSRLAAAKQAADLIRADEIRRDVDYLASDANMGRRTPHPGAPSPGYNSTAAYVARRLKELGITPMGDSTPTISTTP